MTVQPGTCRYCGCTEDRACKLPNGDPCAWFTNGRTVCNSPACITAYYAERRKVESEAYRNRPRKRTPADIHRLKLEERRKKQREYRARRRGRVA